MSNKNYTHIVLLVDASGSMETIKQATIEGINTFIETQKQLPPVDEDRNLSFEDDLSDGKQPVKCTATLITFSSSKRPNWGHSINGLLSGGSVPVPTNGEPAEPFFFNRIYKEADIAAIPSLTNSNYDTYGGTPLIDAFHKAITECSQFIAKLPETERPGRVILVSHTDGEENDSKQHKREELKTLIEEKNKLNWQFIYIGANQDAFNESKTYGIQSGQALNFMADSAGTTRSYAALASNVMSKRCTSDLKMMSNFCISDFDESSKLTSSLGGSTTANTLTGIGGQTFTSANMTSGKQVDFLNAKHPYTEDEDADKVT